MKNESGLKQLKGLTSMLDNIAVGVAYVDKTRTYVFVNPSYARLFGLKQDEIQGKHVNDIFPPRLQSMAERHHERALKGETFVATFSVPITGPELQHLSINFTPDFNEAGEVVGFMVMANERPDFARFEAKSSELQHATVGISRTSNLESLRGAIQKHVLSIFGADRGVLVELSEDGAFLETTSVWNFSTPELEPWIRYPISTNIPIAECVRTGEAIFIEDERARGVPYAVEIPPSLAALPLVVNSKVIGAIALVYNEHRTFPKQTRYFMQTLASHCAEAMERAMLFEQVQSTQQQLALAAEASELGIWDWHPTKHKLSWSPKLQEIYGLKPGEFRNTFEHYQELLFPDDRELLNSRVATAIETRTPFDTVHRIRWPDGTVHWVHGRGKPFFNEKGELIRVVGTSINIDKKVRDEEALKDALLAAQKAIRARDEFLSIASHELKTPLTSLRLQTQMTKKNLLLKGETVALAPERMLRLVHTADRQVDRLSQLVDDMLDISRISTGKLYLRTESVDLGKLSEDVIERMSALFQDVGCSVNLKVEGSGIGNWDRDRLEQVLTNLLTNACRYGGGTPVEVTVTHGPDAAILSVRDHGRGIAKEDQQRIFGRYERAVSLDDASGLGLGLFIVSEILERHGGSISVTSELGAGATFEVKLPYQFKENT